MVRFFDDAAVRAALRWDALIGAMESALAELSAGRVLQPTRTMLAIEENRRYLGIMPAVAHDAMGLKLLTFYPANAGSAVPTHMAIVLLFRTDTGEPLAVLDGGVITEMRTAAVSAAVTRRIASRADGTLGLLGSGVQAKAHLEALRAIGTFDDIRVWSPNAAHRERFAAAHGVRAVDGPEAAVLDADVVVVATMAREPVLRGAWLKRGVHVNAVGAPRPTWRELDDDAMRNALIVDSREAVRQESGDVILSRAPIYAEAGELFAGTKPRPPVGESTIFKSVGLAVEDVAAAKLVYDTVTAGER